MKPLWFFGRIRERITATVKKQGIQLDKKLVFRRQEHVMPSAAQWRRFPQLLNRTERRVVGVLILVLVLSGVVAFFGFTGGRFAFVPKDGGRWIEGEVGAVRLVNPILATRDTDRDVVPFVYSGLMRETALGIYTPDLADRIVVSPDATRYTISLRKDAQFHDGELLTPADVLFTYHAIANAAWRSPYWKSLKDIQVTSPDEHTVVFSLGKPFPLFQPLLAIGILPEHIWKDVTPEQSAFAIWNVKPIGTGPFQFDSLTRTSTGSIESMDLVRNRNFYEQRPHLDSITFQFFDDLPSVIAALNDGRVHGTFVPARHTDTVFPEKRFRVTTFDTPQVVTLYMNEKNQIFTDGVRTALSQAIDRAGILKRLANGAHEAFGPVPIAFGDAGLSAGQAGGTYEYNSEAGKATFAKLKIPLTLNLVAPADPFYHDIVESLKASFADVGVTLHVNELDGQDFIQTVRARSYDILLWSSFMPYGIDLYPYWHSSQADDFGLNFSGYNNRKADTVLEKLRTMTVNTDRASAYADLTVMLRKDVPAVFLVSPRPQYVATQRLHATMPSIVTFGASRFMNIRDWYIKQSIAW